MVVDIAHIVNEWKSGSLIAITVNGRLDALLWAMMNESLCDVAPGMKINRFCVCGKKKTAKAQPRKKSKKQGAAQASIQDEFQISLVD